LVTGSIWRNNLFFRLCFFIFVLSLTQNISHMTKAQEKRNKQFRESLTRRLTNLFTPFRNYNYESYVNSQLMPHKNLVESHWGTYSDCKEAFESLQGKTFGELGIEPHIDRYHGREGNFRRKTKKEMEDDRNLALQKPIEKESQLYGKMRQVEQSRKVMSTLEIHRLEWLMAVKEAFDNRFNKMIDSMCDNITPKGGYFDIQVEELSNSWNEFEVLIHVEETTFHARAIWVNCVDKVSHYRFITTTRKRK